MKAIWRGKILAESASTVVVEGNHYFPPGSVAGEYLRNSDSHTVCPWKGTASYYDLVVDSGQLKDGAWYYPEPKQAAQNIKGHVAFWKGVVVEE